MKLWSLDDGRGMRAVALRTRDDVRIWAGERMMPAKHYKEAIEGDYNGRAMRVWKAVLWHHPKARLVRVEAKVIG